MLLLDYLPDFMQEIKEMQVIMETSQPFIENINLETENFLKDMFILEASENGTSRYEKMLGIVPKLTESLEKRKHRIFLKYNEKLPYTYRSLMNLLDTICGENNYKLNVSTEELSLIVKVGLKSKDLLETVKETLERVVPMNVYMDIDLLYNVWETLSPYTWGDLRKYTWKDLKESDLDGTNG